MRSDRIAAGLAALALLLASAAAGCGGSGDGGEKVRPLTGAQYRVELKAATAQLTRAYDGLAPAAGRRETGRTLRRRLTGSAARLRRAGHRLARLRAPDDARAANAKLAAGMIALGAAFERAAGHVRDDDVAAALFEIQSVDTADGIPEIQRAIATLKQAGYGGEPGR